LFAIGPTPLHDDLANPIGRLADEKLVDRSRRPGISHPRSPAAIRVGGAASAATSLQGGNADLTQSRGDIAFAIYQQTRLGAHLLS
jgi:hypothetical protein